MDRVACDLQAALLKENHDVIKENYAVLRNAFQKKYGGSCQICMEVVDLLDLCDKGVLNKCFSVYGCIPSSHSTNYIPIWWVKEN